jgi:hypothetical protein
MKAANRPAPAASWRSQRAILENNIADTSTSTSSCFYFSVNATSSTKVFTRLVFRSNRIRPKDGVAAPLAAAWIFATNCQNLTIENNIVDETLPGSDPYNFIQVKTYSTIQAFDNRESSGLLSRVYDLSTSLHVGELTTDAESILLTI